MIKKFKVKCLSLILKLKIYMNNKKIIWNNIWKYLMNNIYQLFNFLKNWELL